MVGNVDPKSEKLVETAFKSLAAAIAIVKPGTLYRYEMHNLNINN